VFTQSLLQLLLSHLLFFKVALNDLAGVDQQPWIALDNRVATSEVSEPVIAFCTAFAISNKRTRSNGVICPTCRLPASRIPISTAA
jgi:hypothetical protein